MHFQRCVRLAPELTIYLRTIICQVGIMNNFGTCFSVGTISPTVSALFKYNGNRLDETSF